MGEAGASDAGSMHETRISGLHYVHQCIDADALERDLRALKRPWLEDFPSLRLACVLIYAGLMLTLAGMSMSASASPSADVLARQVSPDVAVDCHFLPGAACSEPVASYVEARNAPAPAVLRGAMSTPGYGALAFLAGFGLGAVLVGGVLVRYRRANQDLRSRLARSEAALAGARARAEELSRSDELTGVANEQRMRHYLAENWQACAERGVPISAVQIDPDRFRSFIEGRGRELGDRALHALAQSLSRQVTAAGGLLARTGGAEFVAVLPGSTADEAESVAERLCEAVIALEFRRPEPETGFLTASLGAATLTPAPDVRPEELMARTDRATAEARRRGGNRVVHERHHGDSGRRLQAG